MIAKDWAEYSTEFQASGDDCDTSNNRIVFLTGRINGILRIANSRWFRIVN